MVVLLGFAMATGVRSAVCEKPNLILMLQDDLGFWDTAFNGNTLLQPVTGNIEQIANDGIILTNHLVHYHCSPTRRSFLTGRLPIHHGEFLSSVDTDDIDLRWTLISDKLKHAGYKTHWIGKGHTGYKSMNHLPTRRGFDSFLGYLSGAQNYNSTDRWYNEEPLTNNSNYSSFLYGQKAVEVVENHPIQHPLFLYLPWQAVHSPYNDVPNWDNGRTDFLPYPGVYAGMLNTADAWSGALVSTLKRRNMWNNTLFVYCSDNGGVTENGLAGNNFPLRGEKHSNWRGGYRVAAFVAGGLIPSRLRGSRSNLRVHIVDWYATFSILAGVSPRDDPPVPPKKIDPSQPHRDIYGNESYPGVDGVNVFGYLTSSTNMTKKGRDSDFIAHPTLTISAEVLLDGPFKLLLGQGQVHDSGMKTVDKDGWRYPNGTWVTAADVGWRCGLEWKDPAAYIPCLFHEDDLREMHDLAPANASKVESMWKALNISLLTQYTSRSPAALLGPCNKQCANKHWKKFGGGEGPICGVTDCGNS